MDNFFCGAKNFLLILAHFLENLAPFSVNYRTCKTTSSTLRAELAQVHLGR